MWYIIIFVVLAIFFYVGYMKFVHGKQKSKKEHVCSCNNKVCCSTVTEHVHNHESKHHRRRNDFDDIDILDTASVIVPAMIIEEELDNIAIDASTDEVDMSAIPEINVDTDREEITEKPDPDYADIPEVQVNRSVHQGYERYERYSDPVPEVDTSSNHSTHSYSDNNSSASNHSSFSSDSYGGSCGGGSCGGSSCGSDSGSCGD